MATAHHVDYFTRSHPAMHRWAELVWVVKIWVAAALVVLMLEIASIHPDGVLMRVWTHFLGF